MRGRKPQQLEKMTTACSIVGLKIRKVVTLLFSAWYQRKELQSKPNVTLLKSTEETFEYSVM